MKNGQSLPQDQDAPIQLDEQRVLSILTLGDMQEQGLLPYSSNHSFLVTVEEEEIELPAVYKPQRGENPLWDFEWGSLCMRETAAYEVSHALSWNLVPPTVLREGTRGLGSVQFFVHCNEDDHYFTVQSDARFASSLRQLALFDYVINNADRKSGHCLIGDDQRMWAIDHGVCFHTEQKLRTVIWEFSDEEIDPDLLADLDALRQMLLDRNNKLSQTLCRLLADREYAAMQRRVESLLRTRVYPAPSLHRRNYPWPPI